VDDHLIQIDEHPVAIFCPSTPCGRKNPPAWFSRPTFAPPTVRGRSRCRLRDHGPQHRQIRAHPTPDLQGFMSSNALMTTAFEPWPRASGASRLARPSNLPGRRHGPHLCELRQPWPNPALGPAALKLASPAFVVRPFFGWHYCPCLSSSVSQDQFTHCSGMMKRGSRPMRMKLPDFRGGNLQLRHR